MVVKGIEDNSMEYWEGIIMRDDHREVECPECQDVRLLEPDAQDFHCDCGVTVECPSVF